MSRLLSILIVEETVRFAIVASLFAVAAVLLFVWAMGRACDVVHGVLRT